MVVMVLTVCLDDVSVHATKRQARNFGSRVPVDTRPPALYLCKRALKNPHSPCQSTATAQPSQCSEL